MEDDRLGDLLRELPREHARPDFTARVVRSLDAAPRSQPRFQLALAGAAAVALVISAGALIDRWTDARQAGQAMRTAQARQVLQGLRAEHERLAHELHELSQPSVVYLGGNEDLDLVIDLGKVRAAEGATPAAFHGETF